MPVVSHLFSDGVERPALVLVHGLGSAGTIWKSLTPQLMKHFKVIAVDLPGHGVAPIHKDEPVDPKSLAHAIVEEIASKHRIFQSHVAGNSLGGWIALEMGALGPDKVKSVTALAPAGLWHNGTTKRFPPSLDARILAKISQHFMKTAYRLPPLKALGYKKSDPSELTPISWTVELAGYATEGWVLYCTGLSPFNLVLMRSWL